MTLSAWILEIQGGSEQNVQKFPPNCREDERMWTAEQIQRLETDLSGLKTSLTGSVRLKNSFSSSESHFLHLCIFSVFVVALLFLVFHLSGSHL